MVSTYQIIESQLSEMGAPQLAHSAWEAIRRAHAQESMFFLQQAIHVRLTEESALRRTQSAWKAYEDLLWGSTGATAADLVPVLTFVSGSIGAKIRVRRTKSRIKQSVSQIEQTPWPGDDFDVSDAIALDIASILANVEDPGESNRIDSAPPAFQRFIRQALSVQQEDCWVRFHGFYDWVSLEDESLTAQIISFRVSGVARIRVAVERRLNSLLDEYIDDYPELSIRRQWPDIIVSVVRSRQ